MEYEQPISRPRSKQSRVLELDARKLDVTHSPSVALHETFSPPHQQAARRQSTHRRRGSLWKQNSSLLIMTIPGLCLLFVFAYLPLFGIIIAFKDYRAYLGVLGSAWVGLQNFSIFSRPTTPGALFSTPSL